MTKPLIDNRQGLGLVAMFCQSVLDEQIAFVRRNASDMHTRTQAEERDMAWDESLMEGRTR